ncbi:MAG: hypothetical protein KGL50_05750, partial [Burkholderiales bacterium]|nr:hypothetical protein [Burkholderiales bacterium]
QTPDQVVLEGPAAVGVPAVTGTMQRLAISAAAGYAIVDLAPVADGTDLLTVSLRPARGGSIDARCTLR